MVQWMKMPSLASRHHDGTPVALRSLTAGGLLAMTAG